MLKYKKIMLGYFHVREFLGKCDISKYFKSVTLFLKKRVSHGPMVTIMHITKLSRAPQTQRYSFYKMAELLLQSAKLPIF